MDLVKEFINEYGTQILMTILTAIAGAVGIVAKNIYKRVTNDQTKRDVADMCVKAVEQIYKNLTGSERYDTCVEAIAEMLDEKGIKTTELEVKMLIESAVGEFNNVFKDSGKSIENSIKKSIESVTESVYINEAETEVAMYGDPICVSMQSDPTDVDEID